ncbi:MAG: hypothetical protein GY838_14015 [bacterium]|nr:hypothetical protein [bacterium]
MSSERPDTPASPGFPPPFRLGDWLVEPSLHRITGVAGALQLSPRNMKVLCYLARQPGQVISRAELLDRVWSGQIVGEEVLTGAVSELRQALGDDTRRPLYIETIRKGGYRLVMEMEPAEAEFPATPAARSRGTGGWRWVGAAIVLLLVVVVWLAGHDGSEPPQERFWQTQPLTSLAGREEFPALSPDGSRVVYVRRGAADVPDRLYLRQCGTTNEILLAEEQARLRHPAWSPDGATVVFVATGEGNSVLRSVPSLGGPIMDLAAWEGRAWGLDWTPDGGGIAVSTAEPGQPARIRILDLPTRRWRPLTDPGKDQDDHLPAFAPDGRTLAFARLDTLDRQHVYLLDLQTEEAQPRRLTHRTAYFTSLSWLPDGSGLVAAALTTDHYQIWRIGLVDGAMAAEQLGHRHVLQASLASRGAGLAAASLDLDYDIAAVDLHRFVADRVVLHPEPVFSSTWLDREPAFSPGGDRVAFTSDRSGKTQIFLADLEDGGVRAIDHPAAAVVRNLRWSPDERHLFFTLNDDRLSSSYTLEIASEIRERLEFAAESCRLQTWSRDGEWFYADLREGQVSTFGRIRRDGSERQELLPEAAEFVHESVSGDTLLVHAHAHGRLVRWIRGTEPTVQKLPFELPGRIRYAATDRHVYMLDSDSGTNTLYRWEIAACRLDTLGLLDARIVGSMTVSPDDSRLLVTVENRRDMDLILVPDFH